MKDKVITILAFFILLFVFAKWGPAINFSTLTQSKGEPMIVTGEGKATAVPDIVKVNAGIQDSGNSLTQVQDFFISIRLALLRGLDLMWDYIKIQRNWASGLTTKLNPQYNYPIAWILEISDSIRPHLTCTMFWMMYLWSLIKKEAWL